MKNSVLIGFTTQMGQYDLAVMEFFNIVIESQFKTNRFYKNMPKFRSVHNGPIRNVRGDDPLDQDFGLANALSSLEFSDIQYTNVPKLTENLCNIALQLITNITRDFFNSMGEVLAKTDQVVNGKGKPFDFDLILDLLEKVQIEFDEDGKAKLPTLVVSPQDYAKINNLNITKEQKEREKEIIEKKREEYYAKKRYRRLSK